MSEPSRSNPTVDRRAAARKPWATPTLASLKTGAAELAGGGADDTVDLS